MWSLMSAKNSSPDAPAYPVSATQQLQDHLRQYPQDLIDIRRLIRRYRLSVREVQHVLNQLAEEGLITTPAESGPAVTRG